MLTCQRHVSALHKLLQPHLTTGKAAGELVALRVLARIVTDHAPLHACALRLQVAAGQGRPGQGSELRVCDDE